MLPLNLSFAPLWFHISDSQGRDHCIAKPSLELAAHNTSLSSVDVSLSLNLLHYTSHLKVCQANQGKLIK